MIVLKNRRVHAYTLTNIKLAIGTHQELKTLINYSEDHMMSFEDQSEKINKITIPKYYQI